MFSGGIGIEYWAKMDEQSQSGDANWHPFKQTVGIHVV